MEAFRSGSRRSPCSSPSASVSGSGPTITPPSWRRLRASTGSRRSPRTSWSPAGGRCSTSSACASATRSRCTACRCRSAAPTRSIATICASCARCADRVEPRWISDHLCWTGVDGRNLHDLLPLPYTDERSPRRGAREAGAGRLGPPHPARERLELRRVRRIADDANGSSSRDSPRRRLRPAARRQQRLRERRQSRLRSDALSSTAFPPSACARSTSPGHRDHGTHIVDTTTSRSPTRSGSSTSTRSARLGPVPTLIERDDDIPPLAELVDELDQARELARNVLAAAA